MDLPTDDHTKVSHSSKDVAWYKEELDDFSPECRELLEKYSYIPPDQVKAHIREIVSDGIVIRMSIETEYFVARTSLGCFPIPMHRPMAVPPPFHLSSTMLSTRTISPQGTPVEMYPIGYGLLLCTRHTKAGLRRCTL